MKRMLIIVGIILIIVLILGIIYLYLSDFGRKGILSGYWAVTIFSAFEIPIVQMVKISKSVFFILWATLVYGLVQGYL